jgi:hypothetical protein
MAAENLNLLGESSCIGSFACDPYDRSHHNSSQLIQLVDGSTLECHLKEKATRKREAESKEG